MNDAQNRRNSSFPGSAWERKRNFWFPGSAWERKRNFWFPGSAWELGNHKGECTNLMWSNLDRLYDLLPVIHRLRDHEQGEPLHALLRVIAEQVEVVEQDIAQLYDNWFIETCQDWVVPYLGDLLGYDPVHEAGEPGDVDILQGRQRNRILVPRREVANTIRSRRRKGTLALLELLAHDVAGWPARAVEFFQLLSRTQALNHQRPERGLTVDLRWGDALDRLDGPFDTLAHTVDVRRIQSHRAVGRYNLPSVGLFVWRLRAYTVTETPAYCVEEVGSHCYTFSVLGNDTPLYTHPQPEAEPTQIAGALHVPTAIRRRTFAERKTDYYGEGKSLHLWIGKRAPEHSPQQAKDQSHEQKAIMHEPVLPEHIVVADLKDWHYRPCRGEVAVDPERGRIIFPPGDLPKLGVWVSYRYGFSAEIGGGKYLRPLSQQAEATVYRVGKDEQGLHGSIGEALAQWEQEKPLHAVIEIAESGVYVEQINIALAENQSLQLRAANRARPVIRLLDWHTELPDNLSIQGAPGSRFTLDGLLITGRGMQVEGALTTLTIRHSTLVPGWALDCDCEPQRPAEPSLELLNTQACVLIEHSIVGSIQVTQNEVRADPIPIHITDSVLDATSTEREALGAPGSLSAHAVLTIVRSTVFGQILTHAIELAENSLFLGLITVARRQRGCLRFCYVTPGSRTPRRYHCQPDLVEQALAETIADPLERAAAKMRERERVEPQFDSMRYGTPVYCRLAHACAEEITRGADDESEMGVFHDLYYPQRVANLRARLEEYTPAGMDAGILYAD